MEVTPKHKCHSNGRGCCVANLRNIPAVPLRGMRGIRDRYMYCGNPLTPSSIPGSIPGSFQQVDWIFLRILEDDD